MFLQKRKAASKVAQPWLDGSMPPLLQPSATIPVPTMPTPPLLVSDAEHSAGPGAVIAPVNATPAAQRNAPVETVQRSATLALRLAARQQPRNTAELVDAEHDTPERDVLSAGNPQQSLEVSGTQNLSRSRLRS